MIKKENYPKAYTEICEILKFVDDDTMNKIPKKFLNMVNEKKDLSYEYTLENGKELEEQVMLRETKAILAYIFMEYLSTENERKIIEEQFRKDKLEEEELKKLKYSTDIFKKQDEDKFKDNVKDNVSDNLEEQEETKDLVEYKKRENVFYKILCRFKNFIHKFNNLK